MSDPRRFRPVRAGIVNLYEYGDQVFGFSGGRLLLRGHNTSGKTKALELLLPFCLDGDIAPHKLDPFARAAKHMKWNLVGCVDDDQRIGYVWVEFERIADDGGVQRVTAGIGLKANRSLPEVRRWHFVARERRVGENLALLRGREPLSRVDLVAELGDDGEVLDHQAAYRERLNALVFGFAGMEQYQTMLRLMLELRRPHLSKTLDPDGVAGMLSAGLPTVDDALMRRVAGGLEQLEALEQGLARLRAVRERARRFHEQTYRTYLRAVLRDRAAELRAAVSNYDRAAAQARRLTDEREAAVRGLA
ncbi:MAG: TIGR02680 family protein, partial [Solirubrobacteraceae bacterium]